MGNLNEWVCACEKDLKGQKCDYCKEAIHYNLSSHACQSWGTCQKKTGW
ncbi:hypothetical protein [Streptococcus suis]|uniref:Laminin EGF-like domain-containing protein n=1 Tax=Streptococcus suis TaxID=1307 RepID=A0A9X4MU34_STRSU|nr:hypothetical protein [Streptococcus suis]MBY5026029.1 hypothetical protein [Streptococcus suis]MDG4527478.1 hypothetical protein [Streptococcus suis]MDG4529792.1 hypothetical protein [Streptococcus suis]QZT16369.1 hypothetical protein K6974_07065 [Streptococcus suis]